MNVYFSDYFQVSRNELDKYGAFNISLINDLPVFIDPFLLFNSEKKEYQELHEKIINYVKFLRDMSKGGGISKGLLSQWYFFPEVKQNWLGFSKSGNSGSGLGQKFATALNDNLNSIFTDFGSERITKSSHLEKLCLIKEGVGKDNISDFTTNLIKSFLCEYTEIFAKTHIHNSRIKTVAVSHVEFNYKTRCWMSKKYSLPYIDGDYILLTPKDILTKDDTWINKNDINKDFDDIVESIPNNQIRSQINEYFMRQISEDAKQKEINEAISATLRRFPELIDHFIRLKEDSGDSAVSLSKQKVDETETIFINQVRDFIVGLKDSSCFYYTDDDTHSEAYKRVIFLKQVIENNDGYRFFYLKGKPIKREADLQLIFRLTWYASRDDVNSEVNNGRGPVDYKISRGSRDSTLVEFKLASNTKLKQNLKKQVEIYKAANQTQKSITVILYFNDKELERVNKIMSDLGLVVNSYLVLIDAQATNKPSASIAN